MPSLMRIDIEMIDALGVERGRAALDAVHDVAFRQQQFGEIGAVLTGDAGDQCNLVGHVLSSLASRLLRHRR